MKKELYNMNIKVENLVSISDANQNFSKVARLVDEKGSVVILKNNKPRYMVLSFQEYDDILAARRKLFNDTSDTVIAENLEALLELAK